MLIKRIKFSACKASLAQGGFFNHEGSYYCTADYQRKFGTKCVACSEYVEGEVVTALGNTYHQKCFTCSSCRLVYCILLSLSLSRRQHTRSLVNQYLYQATRSRHCSYSLPIAMCWDSHLDSKLLLRVEY
jgi:hypothetical protein